MLFLLFGGGTRYRDHGPGHERHCDHCHNTTTWTRVRRVREITVFFIPIARWGRRDLEACPICGTQLEADAVTVPGPISGLATVGGAR